MNRRQMQQQHQDTNDRTDGLFAKLINRDEISVERSTAWALISNSC